MPIQIKNRDTGEVIFTSETATDIRGAVSEACLGRVSLCSADLAGAALTEAALIGADLTGTNLRGADLTGADLSEASLVCADLSGANLRRANLSRAPLVCADLSGANLRWANLSQANLRRANLADAHLGLADMASAGMAGAALDEAYLYGTDLNWTNLATFKQDLWLILSQNRAEVGGLVKALQEGRVNGRCYEGDCACLIGTIANVRGCAVAEVPSGTDVSRPAEQWFLVIRSGDTPDTNSVVKITLEWIAEWQATNAQPAPL